MNVSVVIPFRSGDWHRDRNLAWCLGQYPAAWEVVVEDDHGSGDWRKGPVLDAGVRRSTGDVIVLADCDIYVGAPVLVEAVNRTTDSGIRNREPWVSPIGTVWRLSESRTRRIVQAGLPSSATPQPCRRHAAVVGGGLVVCTRDAYELVGGIDPRFSNWGGEDLSFGRALDTLVGHGHRGSAHAWHLWHPPMPRRDGTRASPENEELANRYLAAFLDPVATRAIISERS